MTHWTCFLWTPGGCAVPSPRCSAVRRTTCGSSVMAARCLSGTISSRSAYICSSVHETSNVDQAAGHKSTLTCARRHGSGDTAELTAAVEGLLASDTEHVGEGLVEVLVRVLLHTGANHLLPAQTAALLSWDACTVAGFAEWCYSATGKHTATMPEHDQPPLTRTGVLRSILGMQQLDVHDIEGIHPLYQAVLAREQPPSDRKCEASAEQHPQIAGSVQSLATDTARQAVDAGSAVSSFANTAVDAEILDARQSLIMLPEAAQLAALRDYLTAATAKDCSIMIALQASTPVHLTAASDARFCGGLAADDGSSPAVGRLSVTEESSIAFKVRPQLGSCHRLCMCTQCMPWLTILASLPVTVGLGR